MGNKISSNQLAEWDHISETLDQFRDDIDLVNDYFDCIIECDKKQTICKKICRDLLQKLIKNPRSL